MAVTTLLLVRHGQSTWNAEGKWQGQADPPLSALGRLQAQRASEKIGTVDAIVTSPQDRAATTAAIIAEAIGVGPIVMHPGLQERHVGPWSGLTRAELDREYPGWVDAGRRPDDWETDESLLERTDNALREVAAAHEGATVLVVCHGGVIHNFELNHGHSEGRLPNLSGRIVALSAVTTGNGEPSWTIGEALRLLDDDQITGGERHRL